MATAEIRSTSLDGHLVKNDDEDYTVTHDADDAFGVSHTAQLWVGQQLSAAPPNFHIYRMVLYFAKPTYFNQASAATLTFKAGANDFSTIDFLITLVDGRNAEETLEVADYGDLLSAIVSGGNTIDTADGWTENDDKVITLNATALAWLNATTGSYFKLALRSKRDIDSTTPPTGTERVGIKSGADATESKRPLLSLTYTGGNTAAPSVTTQAVTDIDKTTATGNGNVTSLGVPEATQHGHVWATFHPSGVSSKTENGVPSATGAFTSSLTGLTQNTKYYCLAYITNSVGTSYGFPDAEFTTLSDVPVVTTDLATKVAVTTALGNGSIDNNGGSAITQHGVCWGASENPTTADDKTEEGATSVIGDFESLMTGLTAETTYHYRAYAVNATGTGYGADKIFTTHAVGSPIVTTELSTNVQATSATGNGTIVDIGGSAVTEHGHCWGTSYNPTTLKTTLGAGSVESFTSDIIDLTAGTAYYIRAYATNSQGTSYGDNDLINAVAGELKGEIAILSEWLVYTSKTGVQRALLGDEF